jgi:hypothetical protein
MFDFLFTLFGVVFVIFMIVSPFVYFYKRDRKITEKENDETRRQFALIKNQSADVWTILNLVDGTKVSWREIVKPHLYIGWVDKVFYCNLLETVADHKAKILRKLENHNQLIDPDTNICYLTTGIISVEFVVQENK